MKLLLDPPLDVRKGVKRIFYHGTVSYLECRKEVRIVCWFTIVLMGATFTTVNSGHLLLSTALL